MNTLPDISVSVKSQNKFKAVAILKHGRHCNQETSMIFRQFMSVASCVRGRFWTLKITPMVRLELATPRL